MSAGSRQNNASATVAMNKSGTQILNKSHGGPEDELAMSLDETDFAISESNFSHSMMSNKIGSFVAG